MAKRSQRARPATLLLVLAAAISAGCGGGSGSSAPAEGGRQGRVARPRFNVLLISLDSTRRDYLSCYGHRALHAPRRPTSPNIDRIAAEGVRMDRAYATSSWTLPAHMGMMTGQPDMVHAVDLGSFRLDESRTTLAEVLHESGYRTAGFFSGPYLDARFGFAQGFDRYEARYGPELSRANEQRRQLQRQLNAAAGRNEVRKAVEIKQRISELDGLIDIFSHRDRSSKAVTDAALGEIDAARKAGERWFVFAHYFDPHYDYTPPPPYEQLFDPDYSGSITGKDFYTNPEISLPLKDEPDLGRRRQVVSKRDLEHIRALYEGEIAWTDSEVGRLLEHLRAGGELDRTLVIIVTDHGDEFFEHGGIGHRHTLLEELVRAALIMRLPGRLPAGKSIAGIVSMADLLPSVLEILDLPLPSEPLASKSFIDLIAGRSDGVDRHALGRLVQYHPFTRIGGPEIARVTVREVFLQGTLKILRWRRWHLPMPGLNAARARAVKAKARQERAKDIVLAWIDLAQTPGEFPQDYRKSFTDPAALAALRTFHDLYVRLERLRHPPSLATGGEEVSAMLRGLGYAGGGVEGESGYDLPPPGAGVLR